MLYIFSKKKYRAKSDKLYYPAFKLAERQVKKLRNSCCVVDFLWIPREMNKEADKLSKWDNQTIPVKNADETVDLLRNEKYFKEYLDNRN